MSEVRMTVGTRRDVVCLALAAFFISDAVLAEVIGGLKSKPRKPISLEPLEITIRLDPFSDFF